MWYKTLFALVFVTYIYRSLVARQREGSLSHTHTSFRILVAILLNNKHPTFQLDLIRKVCRILLHDTIVLTFYIYGTDCQKKVLATTKKLNKQAVSYSYNKETKCPTAKIFCFLALKNTISRKKTVSSNKIFLVVSRKFEKFTTVHCMFFVVEQFTNFFCMIQSNVID